MNKRGSDRFLILSHEAFRPVCVACDTELVTERKVAKRSEHLVTSEETADKRLLAYLEKGRPTASSFIIK